MRRRPLLLALATAILLSAGLLAQSALVRSASVSAQAPAAASLLTATPTPFPVRITLKDAPDPVRLGFPIVYTVGLHNLTGQAQSGVTAALQLPAGTTFLEATGGGVYSEDGAVTWTVPRLAAGGTYYVQATVDTPANVRLGVIGFTALATVNWSCRPLVGSLGLCTERASQTTAIAGATTPTATVTPDCADDAGDTFGTATVLVSAQLTLAGFDSEICPAGDEDWWKFTVPAYYAISAQLTLLEGEFDLSLSSPAGPVVATSAKTGRANESITYRALSTAGDYRIRVFPRAGTGAAGGYHLVLRLTAPSPTPTPTPTRTPTRTVTPTSTVTPTRTRTSAPGLSIDKRLVTTNLVAGEIAEYSIKITNNGPGTAHNLIVSDVLPSTRSVYVRSSPVATPVGAPVTSLNWPVVATLAQGASMTYQVQVRVDTDVPPGQTLSNAASVLADGVAGVSDTSTAPVAAPDIELDPDVDTSPVAAGQKVSFHATVSNLGPGRAQGIRVSVRLDSNLQNPVAGSPPISTYDSDTRTITWSYGDMIPNDSATFYVEATVNPALAAGFAMHADWTVTATGMPNTTADQGIAVDQGAPVLSIDKRLETINLVAGEIAEYSIKITNNGPGTAHNLLVSDVLPSTRSVYVRSSPVATPVGAPVTSLNWPVVATLAQGASMTYQVQVRVDTDVPPGQTLSNAASVLADGVAGVSDTSTAPVAAPDIELDPDVDTSPVAAGQKVSFHATVGNLGPGRAQGIRVSVRLDSNLQNPVAGSPPISTYDSDTRTITWSYGDMIPNDSATFYVEATANPALAAGFAMHADWTVTATGMPYTTADQGIAVDQARPVPSVGVEHSVAPDPLTPGDTATWSATVSQNSSYPLSNFRLKFKAPADLPIILWSSGCARHATNNWVICPLDGAADSEQTKTVTVEAPAGSSAARQVLMIEVMADEMLSPEVFTDELQIGAAAADTALAGCAEWLVNGGFELPGWAAWAHGGATEPVIVAGDAVVPTRTLRLAPGSADTAGLSWVRQTVTLPEDTSTAWLSFRYRTGSRDADSERDWFVAAITGGEGETVYALRRHGGRTAWQTVTADLTGYAGQTIGILFAVRNDGQAGRTWADVDDVSLCVSASPPEGGALGACSLPESLPDYAPVGLPDFDQRQAGWQKTVGERTAWTHDGPAALADLLWWQDSAAEIGAAPPPTVADSHALVSSYGSWDDHDVLNAPRLVEDLAERVQTDAANPGTDLGDLVAGLRDYLATKGLADTYDVTLRRSPSFDWVRDAVVQHEPVLLLLGFWEQQAGGWQRLGGHYVAAAAAGCTEDQIAFSDPFRDGAEYGWPGRFAPAAWHGHLPGGPFTLHNDVAYVSHDLYGILRTAGGWGPQGYARRYDDIANFFGLNSAPALEESRAAGYNGGQILTLADYALVLAPRSPTATLRLAPATSRVAAGEIFAVEIAVDAGTGEVDRGQAFLDFDPAVLRVVDEDGNPTSKITPGGALATVVANAVDNAAGRINFVAEGAAQSGRFTLAIVRFKALGAVQTSRLAFSAAAPRGSNLLSGGASVLEGLRGGSVAVQPGVRVSGQVAMEGRPDAPDASWSVPLLLTLGQPGERGPAYAFGTTSDPSGAFAIQGVAVPGEYRVRLKGVHTLRNLLPTDLVAGANTLDLGTLLEGDVLGDDRINGLDASLLAASFGESQGQAGFDPRADLNEDNTVDAADLALLAANLGRRGDVLLGASAASAAQEELPLTLDLTPQPAGSVRLRIVPSSSRAAIGQIITLNLVADAGTQPVDTVELHVDYDPDRLQLVDAADAPTATVEPGAALGAVLLNRADAAWGQVNYIATSAGAAAPSGEFLVARLQLKVLQAGKTAVRFSFSDWRETDAAYQGESVLGSVQAASIRNREAPLIYLPLVAKH